MDIQKVSFSKIPSKAIEYWRKTIIFQVVFSLFYFGIYVGLNLFLYQYFGILDELQEISEYMLIDTDIFKEKFSIIVSSEAFQNIVLCMVVVSAILFPLNIGLLNIYRKIDNLEKISLRDLFIGYEGYNFFKFFGYALFWGGIYHLCKEKFIFFMGIWILVTLLVAPLMFLQNMNVFKAIRLSFDAFIKNILSSLAVMLLAIIGSYLGFLFVFIGILFTFPFWNAVLYVFYKETFFIQNTSEV